ncbi:aminopeptidase [Chondromyces crocatus]|uniref:Aminopeptidase n=1 Tax=Chondromyces crocatus TaxID=52 RepID=A0A0K1EKU2_CHOCO|nr:aminopeptidase [Chondromyces crocatus]AKT41490.1 uncharacterized protein CMC5_056980 [Chondromyces crocatus]
MASRSTPLPPCRPWRSLSGICALALTLALCAASTGCTSVGYLAQAGMGQLSLGLGAQPIREVVKDPSTPPRLRHLLWRVSDIKRFGEQHGLQATDSYETYTALDRPVAVYVVSACAPLEFKAKTWSFPIVGSVPYLGWFDRDRARSFGAELVREGWDVDVRGASAYSTLGWFSDPVLSSMIHEGDEALGEFANTLLHESAHATFYVAGQSILNESVATFIGDKLADRWLAEESGASAEERRAYLEEQRASTARRRVLHETYVALDQLYRSARPDAEKRLEKRKLLAAVERQLEAKRPLTNATLIQYRTYNAGIRELENLLTACGGSFPRLISALKRLDRASFSKPQQEDLGPALSPLVRAGCP